MKNSSYFRLPLLSLVIGVSIISISLLTITTSLVYQSTETNKPDNNQANDVNSSKLQKKLLELKKLYPAKDSEFVAGSTGYTCSSGLNDQFNSLNLNTWLKGSVGTYLASDGKLQINIPAFESAPGYLTLKTPIAGNFNLEFDLSNFSAPTNDNAAVALLSLTPATNNVTDDTGYQSVAWWKGDSDDPAIIESTHLRADFPQTFATQTYTPTNVRFKIERIDKTVRIYFRDPTISSSYKLLSQQKYDVSHKQYFINFYLWNSSPGTTATSITLDNFKVSCPSVSISSNGLSYASGALSNASYTCNSALTDNFNQFSPLLWATDNLYGSVVGVNGELKLTIPTSSTGNTTTNILNKKVSGDFFVEVDINALNSPGGISTAALFVGSIDANQAIGHSGTIGVRSIAGGTITSTVTLTSSTNQYTIWEGNKVRVRIERVGTQLKFYYRETPSTVYTLFRTATLSKLTDKAVIKIIFSNAASTDAGELVSKFDNFKLGCIDSGATTPLYQFYSPAYKKYFYTNSENEKTKIINTDPNWNYTSITANVKDKNSCSLDGQSVFRFYSSVFRSHFFTAKASERDKLINTDPNWRYEGEGFCISPLSGAGLKPIYRLYSSSQRTHYFTASSTDATNKANSGSWKNEGIVFYGW